MKIKKLINGWRLLAILAVAMSASACSDGELAPAVNANITPPAPVIITFAADPVTVNSGGSTKISWEVAGADSVEITAVSSSGAAPDFHVQSSELSGEATASNLTATTDFVLTAKKTAASPESSGGGATTKSGQIQFGEEPDASGGVPAPTPSESAVTQTITVTVIGGTAPTITADKTPVDSCAETIIRWTSEGTNTTVTASTGEQIVAKDQCPQTGDLTADIAAINAAPAVDPTPAAGCAVVKPCENTIYTVKNDGGDASVTVNVNSGNVTANIYAGKDETEKKENLLQVESFSNPVYISWKAEPASAKVTITATPSATCDPVLPTDATDKAESSSKCTITGETKFVISAQVGSGQPATKEVDVVQNAAGSAGLVIAEKWALEGEKVDLDISLEDSAKGSAVSNVKVYNTDILPGLLTDLRDGKKITVKDIVAKGQFVKVDLLINGSSKPIVYYPVPVVSLMADDKDDDVVAVTSLEFSKDLKRYKGVQLSSYNDGVGRIYIDGSKKDVPFGKSIKDLYGMDKMWNDAFFKDVVKTYPTAVTTREDNTDEVYVGITGAVMRSKDGGKSFDNVMVTRRRAADMNSYNGNPNHATCGRGDDGAQKIQAGKKPEFEGDFISLNQICDIVAMKDGRVIVATDFGVQVEKNIDDSSVAWIGTPAVGTAGESIGALTFGHVVNDLQMADGKLFAADDNGVFVSPSADADADKIGIKWEAFGSLSSPVWALAYDARNKTIYAGTNDGVYASPIDSANWSQKGMAGEAAISLAIDPSVPVGTVTVIAGTPKGVKITRDGATWQDIALTSGEQAVEAVAIASKDNGDLVDYAVSFGTTGGESLQVFHLNRVQAEPQTDLQSSAKFQAQAAVSPIQKYNFGN